MKKRLNFVMYLMTGLIVFQLIVLIGSISVFKSIRTLVAGQAHWSNAQKSSLLALSNYAHSGDEKHLKLFYNFTNVITADRTARLELLKKDFNYDVAFDSLVAGKNDPSDVKVIIIFLRATYKLETVQEVFKEWEKGDRNFERVLQLGREIQDEINSDNYQIDYSKLQDLIARINLLNDEFIITEERFSRILLTAARSTEEFLTISLLLIVLSIFSVGYLLFISLINTFNTSMRAMKFSIGEAVDGNYDALLSLKNYEDVGDLSLELNRLLLSLKEQMLGRLSAEVGEARLSLLADAMPQIVCIRDKHGELEFMNQRAWDFLGLALTSPKNVDLRMYIHPEDYNEAVKSFDVSLADKKIIESEFRLRSISGEYIWFLSRSVPVVNQEGEVTRWYSSLTDIEAQKNANLQLLKAIEIRDQFLSIASHELKTPLTSYKLQLHIRKRYLEKEDYSKFSPERLVKMVNDDERQVNRLVRLVDDMLDISRIKTGKMETQCSEFCLEELMIEIVKRFKPQFRELNAEVIFKESSAITVNWDRHKIEQVIVNLLTNAMKYGNAQNVEVSLFKKGDLVSFQVKDHGIGISPDDQVKVFDLFERVFNPKSVTGLGLGLFIVKQIIEAHRGKINIQSELEKGSIFIIEIPRS